MVKHLEMGKKVKDAKGEAVEVSFEFFVDCMYYLMAKNSPDMLKRTVRTPVKITERFDLKKIEIREFSGKFTKGYHGKSAVYDSHSFRNDNVNENTDYSKLIEAWESGKSCNDVPQAEFRLEPYMSFTSSYNYYSYSNRSYTPKEFVELYATYKEAYITCWFVGENESVCFRAQKERTVFECQHSNLMSFTYPRDNTRIL